MTQKPDGGPAYPITAGDQVYGQGMSLRDYIAAKQAANIFAHHMSEGDVTPKEAAEVAAIWSYVIADAMIAARDAT